MNAFSDGNVIHGAVQGGGDSRPENQADIDTMMGQMHIDDDELIEIGGFG